MRDCIWAAISGHTLLEVIGAPSKFQNVLFAGKAGFTIVNGSCEFRGCTLVEVVEFGSRKSGPGPHVLVECIVHSLRSKEGEKKLERCAGYASPPYVGKVKPNADCFIAPPQFVNPATLDFRLGPTSPCRGKASNGGGLGVRYTPEMLAQVRQFWPVIHFSENILAQNGVASRV